MLGHQEACASILCHASTSSSSLAVIVMFVGCCSALHQKFCLMFSEKGHNAWLAALVSAVSL